ncbi:MAG: precorrin-6y C5,15-methyltransferase (decarboxylating) subunit CbiE [Alphaproteobacteria bacterium]|nr:precorrin-6y C5,15-methyltransferase (decarboxylating) subunit CbiE [Alphaproteobacteria bacterium]
MAEQSRKWLTIIGIGDDGFKGLSPANQTLSTQADILLAAERHLQDMPKIKAEIHVWGSPLHKGIQKILSWRDAGLDGKNVVILATGDPMHFGIGATMAKRLPIDELLIIPSPSAFSLAAARLGWGLRKVQCVSVHGRSLSLLHKVIQHDAKIIALTSTGATVDEIADLLVDRGFGNSKLTILEHMGGKDERMLSSTANGWQVGAAADFNSIAIEAIADDFTPIIPNIAGLDDMHYVHDGQLTKADIRAATLNKLLPTIDSVMWDLGAGAGSVGIEYMRLGQGSTSHAVEQNEQRSLNIKINAENLGVPNIKIHHGDIMKFAQKLPTPDAVFIGGGLTLEVFNMAYEALRLGGRLVINVISLEGLAYVQQICQKFNQDFTQLRQLSVTQISTSNLMDIGKLHTFKPNIAVTQLALIKVKSAEGIA